MVYRIREMKKAEYPLLQDFLYEAIFTPAGSDAPPRTILNAPELQVYVSGFGTQVHDRALVAEVSGQVVGAVWTRIMHDYGHIDGQTPSLAISLYQDYRGQRIGTAMMNEMIARLKAGGYRRTSLSVQKANRAAGLYQTLGYQIFRETEAEYIMVLCLEQDAT